MMVGARPFSPMSIPSGSPSIRRRRCRRDTSDHGDRASSHLRAGGRHAGYQADRRTAWSGDRGRLLSGAPCHLRGRPIGSFGEAAAYSFYPTKNLGALGDGGALTVNDDDVAARARRLRNGGQTDRYHHAEFGVNSRLDEIRAAILRERLPRLAGWTAARRILAKKYRAQARRAVSVAVPLNAMPGTSIISSR